MVDADIYPKVACSAGVFFERAICLRKRHVETSRREEEMGRLKGSGEGAGREKRKRRIFSPLPLPPFLLLPSHLPEGLLFLLSPIFHCHKIKDGGYNNITNTNKVSPTQITPALQANPKGDVTRDDSQRRFLARHSVAMLERL